MGEPFTNDEEVTPTKFILRRLPSWMPISENKGNYKLAATFGDGISRFETEFEDVADAMSLEDADTIPQLQKHGSLVEVQADQGESVDNLRARVVAAYQTTTTETTTADLIENTATLLDVKPSAIGFKDLSENGAIQLLVPNRALNNTPLDDAEIKKIVNQHVAAGYRLEVTLKGTFTYLDESEYSGAYDSANGGYDSADLNSDATKGHDGLDTNDNPKDNGGTYSGLIN